HPPAEPPAIAPLSLHDALPIYAVGRYPRLGAHQLDVVEALDPHLSGLTVGVHVADNAGELDVGFPTMAGLDIDRVPALDAERDSLGVEDGPAVVRGEVRGEAHPAQLASDGHVEFPGGVAVDELHLVRRGRGQRLVADGLGDEAGKVRQRVAELAVVFQST